MQLDLEGAAQREAFVAKQQALRARLRDNLELIATEIRKLQAEKQMLEVKIGKLEGEQWATRNFTEKWWNLLSELNVAQKRFLKIPVELKELQDLARSLEPLIKQAGRDVVPFKQQAV